MEIIVASSNVFRRELSSYLLSEAGYHVHEVSDSHTLLHCLGHVQAKLVLLDAHMMGADSSELGHYLQQHATIPIMLMTNGAPVSVATHMLPINDNVSWPYDAQDLLAHVDALLQD